MELSQFLKTVTENNKTKEERLIEKRRKKFEETHQLINIVQPVDKRTGVPHTRFNKETGQREPVHVPVFKFKGWDQGKKYTVEKLQQLRRERGDYFHQKVEEPVHENA